MQVIRQVRLVIQQQHRFLSCVIPCEGTIKQYLPGQPYELKKGDELHWKRVLTQEIINQFANVICDFNPIHFDPSKGPTIAHGMLYGSMFSAMIGNYLPGTRYLKQTLEFSHPVPAGSEVEATIRVNRMFPSKHIAILDTTVSLQNVPVSTGQATIRLPF